MELVDIKSNIEYLKEYIKCCTLEWGKPKSDKELNDYINKKTEKILSNNYDNLICAIGLIEDNVLIGFISLFKTDGDERQDLTPWYATMYVKKEYRGLGYSKILNSSIINEAKRLGYDKVYLKSNLINYYEKFGAIFIEKLNNGDNLYYINV